MYQLAPNIEGAIARERAGKERKVNHIRAWLGTRPEIDTHFHAVARTGNIFARVSQQPRHPANFGVLDLRDFLLDLGNLFTTQPVQP